LALCMVVVVAVVLFPAQVARLLVLLVAQELS
jgi:hypothetical protein